MRRLVFITQQVDPEHPVLGAIVGQLAALAQLVDEVVVVTDRAVPGVLPPNCRTRTFGAPTKLGRGIRLLRAILAELRGLRGGAVIAHMCPVYAVLTAPIVRARGVPILLWYVHWFSAAQAPFVLRVADRLCTGAASVDTRSYPLPSRNLTTTGQAIQIGDLPSVGPPPPSAALRVLVAGRYSPAKGIETVVRGVKLALDAGVDTRLTVHGPATTAEEQDYRTELGRLVGELALEDQVTLREALPRAELISLFAHVDLFVNNSLGGADKGLYEAAASCVPALASNPIFADVLDPELRFAWDDPAQLAERLEAFARLDRAERATLGQKLRPRVAASHSVESWARQLVAAAGLPVAEGA